VIDESELIPRFARNPRQESNREESKRQPAPARAGACLGVLANTASCFSFSAVSEDSVLGVRGFDAVSILWRTRHNPTLLWEDSTWHSGGLLSGGLGRRSLGSVG
jgi:hypothetical protein